MNSYLSRHWLSSAAASLLLVLFSLVAHAQEREPVDLYTEVADHIKNRMKELASEGQRITSARREALEGEQKSLAKKYAAELATRPALEKDDLYFHGRLYYFADNETKALETFRLFLAAFPPNADGVPLQSARSFVTFLASKQKLFDEAAQTYERWIKAKPFNPSERPALAKSIAVSLYKDGKYDDAIRYGEDAFSVLKGIEAHGLTERRAKMKLYADLVEVLALSYRKVKRNDDALNVLAETRALSFTIPSAQLYRSVMDIVQGSGFSEKKLMQKVESYEKADPVPEMKIEEWLGQEPATLESFRGRVVLLDFWATWCMPCISTFPRLREWHKKYGPKGLSIIGVTRFYGGDGKKMTPFQELEFLTEFKAKHKLPYPFAISEGDEAAAKFDVRALPTTMLLDRNGVVRYIGIGAGYEEVENLEEMIQKLTNDDSKLALR